jgi:4-oxalocrotonate tautomerase
MPIVQITLVDGRSPEVKERLLREVTRAVAESLSAPVESIRVFVQEVDPRYFYVGGVPKGGTKVEPER